MGSDTKKLERSDDNKGIGVTVEQHAASVVESGRGSGGTANTHQQVMIPPSGETILKEFTFSELQRATRNFRQDTVLGEGGFGRVYKGWLDSDKIAVAIKKFKAESALSLKEWQAELMFLGRIRHPNLVKLFGYCWENRDYFLVYEFVRKGSLEDHLFRKGAEPLPWYTRIKIAIGVAQGLAFLHARENSIICRDFKSSNILLDEDFNAKISDFGLAKSGALNGTTHVSTAITGSYGYMAPEYIATGHLYIKSDVYTFGMVMLEIMTGLRAHDAKRRAMKHNLVDWTTPFLSDKKRLQRIMDPRLEQDYPAKGARKVVELITNCVETDPKKRPSKEVASILQRINAIKMKPSQSKSKTNTRHPAQYCHQNHQSNTTPEEWPSIDVNVESSNKMTHLNPSMVVAAPEEYYLRFPIKNIDDIPDYNEEVGLSIIATIIGFDLEEGWYSFYCRNCSKKVTKNDVDSVVEPFNCDDCGGVSDVYDKIRVVIRVQDETGSSSFVLFERHIKDLIHHGKQWLMDKISKDQEHQNIPDEFNSLLNKKFVFKVQISLFNLENKYLPYTVHKLTDDESVLAKVFKRSPTYEQQSIHDDGTPINQPNKGKEV